VHGKPPAVGVRHASIRGRARARQVAAVHPAFAPTGSAGPAISLACRPAALYLGNMEVQIFGTKKSADTRKALRFFSERRVRTHFVDLQQRAASPGELRRFAGKFGVQALIDTEQPALRRARSRPRASE
jgi:hypothetical protein